MTTLLAAFYLVYFLILYWAVSLAMKVHDPDARILHLSLAFLTPPVYILMFFISHSNKKDDCP